jgi:hypothetical protein
MKKIYLITIFLLSLNLVFAQWTKIASVPATNIVAFRINNNIIYAATASNVIYKSTNGGVDWTSVKVSNDPIDITSLIFYNNKIYVGTFNFGVFFSSDDGNTWQNNGPLPKWISEFAIKDSLLYASTLGSGVAVMNPNTNSWSFLNATLPDYSSNVFGIIGSPNFLMIAAGANGTFYTYDFNNSFWREKYYDGVLHPSLLINKLINNADTIFAVNFQRIIKSTNAGLNWTNDKVGSHDGTNRIIYSGANYYYTLTNTITPAGTWIQQRNRNAGIGSTWATDEEFLPDGFSWDIIEFNKKLFLGKADGLYFKNLSDIVFSAHFISFNTTCNDNKVTLTWKTVQEQNSSRFDIEKSIDGIHWTVSGTLPSAGNSNIEKTYSFTDNNPDQSTVYRIAEYTQNGSVQYTGILQSFCTLTDTFNLWPNPARDRVFINIFSATESQALIRIFDSKGALVKVQKTNILPGNNHIGVDLESFANGIYTLYADWHNGKLKKAVQVLKH